jgi:hypothetical protein
MEMEKINKKSAKVAERFNNFYFQARVYKKTGCAANIKKNVLKVPSGQIGSK